MEQLALDDSLFNNSNSKETQNNMGFANNKQAQADGEEKVEMKFKDVNIVSEGSQIILPKGMTPQEGVKWLQRKQAEDDRTVAINEQIDAFPLDGAYALARALNRKYGFTSLVPTPGFWGPRPPMLIGVQINNKDTAQVPWGRMQIPNVDGHLSTHVGQKDGRQIFVIGGEVKQRHKAEISEIAQMAREIVRNESIYKGKAIKVSFPNISPEDFDPTAHAPKFMDVSAVSEDDLIFPDSVHRTVTDSLFTPIEKTQECRDYKIPLKRGILLEGPYGTGKTLTAYVTAKKAVANGWTFIYLNSVSELQRAIFFAQQYGPAVIFAEDIDQVLKGGRDDAMNGILNTIDGVDTKGSELIVVLTTNHVDDINPAMLRPGRLDAVIPVRPPDAKAVARLIKLYARGLVNENENFEEAGKILDGKIPAIIREAVERSKLSALTVLQKGEKLVLTGESLAAAATGLMAQVELINPKRNEKPHPMELFGRAVGREIAFGQVVSSLDSGELEKVLPAEIVKAAETLQKKLVGQNGSAK